MIRLLRRVMRPARTPAPEDLLGRAADTRVGTSDRDAPGPRHRPAGGSDLDLVEAAPHWWANRPALPGFAQTIRFRLTVLYSTLLFALAALVLGGIYFAVSKSTEARPITQTYQAEKGILINGAWRPIRAIEVAAVRDVELAANYQTLQTLKKYSLATLGGLFIASLGIGWALSGRALRPVRAITQTAAEIQATDLSRRIQLSGPKDELRSLADTVDSMLDRLDEAFQAQRRLIDDASHELRSPLAILRANVDAVLADPDSTEEERRRAAAVVGRATTRMTRLVEDLLATARRSAPAFADADVDLAMVTREACEEFAPLADRRDLIINRRLTGGLTVIGDHDALRRAVGNLLSNAVRLAPAGTHIDVAADRLDGWLWIAVKDGGPGLHVDDQNRVFDRFWRGSPEQRHDARRHTGLGLAIVRQIVESHGGQVRLFSAAGAGSTFVLWFPEPGGNGRSGPVPDTDPLAT